MLALSNTDLMILPDLANYNKNGIFLVGYSVEMAVLLIWERWKTVIPKYDTENSDLERQ